MSTAFVIFGASGDLTARKLIPALYGNFRKGRLPDDLTIIGFSRSPFSDESFRNAMREAWHRFHPGAPEDGKWGEFQQRLHYLTGDPSLGSDMGALAERVRSAGTRIYYLATVPDAFGGIIRCLHEAGMMGKGARLVVEKPFGYDLASALSLTRTLCENAAEDQIYRIDHYLGKETVQNLLVLRFGNAIFEPLWNRNYIDHCQITVAEAVGVEHRAGYYDRTGVLRDMFQNHLLQLLTLLAMEPPSVFEADALRNEKVKVLRALQEIPPEQSARHTVRAQYDGYRSEPGVDPHSATETFAALRCMVDNWRWQGVPFYLRSGKCLHEKSSEIIIQFRRPPTQILDLQAGRTELFTNRLSICIQPDEGIHLRFVTKVPDEGLRTRPVDMDFRFSESFGRDAIPDAYERLLLDAVNGDPSLFARSDEIEHAWRFIDGIREGWNDGQAAPLESYARGSWGPAASDHLLGRERRWWIHDCLVQGKEE